MSDYSWKELMAVVFAREIKDTDKITSGAHTEIFFAATMLAQKTHAPSRCGASPEASGPAGVVDSLHNYCEML